MSASHSSLVAKTPLAGAELPRDLPSDVEETSGELKMSDDFKPGLEGVIAFESEIAEPDKEGSALR